MTLHRKSDEQLLAEIRDWFARGYTEAATERLLALAEKRSDNLAFMRAALNLTCEALTLPKPKRPRSRPPLPKPPRVVDGVTDLDSATPMTEREKLRATKRLIADYAIAEAVEAKARNFSKTDKGAFREVANGRGAKASAIRKAYYRPKSSPKV